MKGQTAFEYIGIFSIVLLMSLILTTYAGQMTMRNQDDIRVSNAMTAVDKIAEAADIVSTQGAPSQITLSIFIPEQIKVINITGKTILMKVIISSGITDIFAMSRSSLQGNISNLTGTRNIKVTAAGNYVNITEG